MMIDVELVRAHEDELEQQSARLVAFARAYTGPACAYAIEVQLTRLVGTWRRLLMWRDRLIYQPLAASGDIGLADVATRCHARMAVLGGRIEEFAQRWSSSVLIAAEPQRFTAEVIALGSALATRFDGDRALLGLAESPVRGRRAA